MPEATQVARCYRCGHDRPWGEMVRDRTKASGRASICKPCERTRRRHVHCSYCDAPSHGERFCSDVCKDCHAWERRAAPIRIRDCHGCGRPFAALGHLTRKHCSTACKRQHKAAQARGRYTTERQREKDHKRRTRKVAARLAAWAPATPPLMLLAGPPLARSPRSRRCDRCRHDGRQCLACVQAEARAKATPASRRFVQGACLHCLESFTAEVKGKAKLPRYCTNRCQVAQHRRDSKALRRARTKGGDRISLPRLANRDGWRCHICKRKVGRNTWSIDHLVPLAHGGNHTWNNVALAHHLCNSIRSDTGAAQLLLTG